MFFAIKVFQERMHTQPKSKQTKIHLQILDIDRIFQTKSGKFLTYTRHEIPLLKIVFKLKFFLAKHESYIILKVFKVKVLSVFGLDNFLTMLNALWWIYKKAHHGIFDFMFLSLSVLNKVSKTLFVFLGPAFQSYFNVQQRGVVGSLGVVIMHQLSS